METIDINGGWPGNFDPSYNPFDDAWYRSVAYPQDQNGDPSGASTPDGPGGGTPPPPDPFEEVVITGTRTKPPPRESFVPPAIPPGVFTPGLLPAVGEITAAAGAALAAGAAAMLGLLMPRPTAPRELDEAPDPMPIVDVVGNRPPPPTKRGPANDFLQPPNWNDLLHDYDWSFPWTYAIPDLGDKDTRERQRDRVLGPSRVDRTVPGTDEDLITIDINARKPRTAPRDTPAPYIFGDAFALPFGLPDFLPYDQPAPQAEPARRTKPVRIVKPIGVDFDVPELFEFPSLDDLLAPTVDPRTDLSPETPLSPDEPVLSPTGRPAPSNPTAGLPPFGFLDPIPRDLDVPTVPSDRIPDTPDGADVCDCAKPKKKERKKRNPRERCYAGTYVEGPTSLKKNPTRWVDCQTGETIGTQER